MGHIFGEISIIWNIDDVKSIAPDLTDQECDEVLIIAKDNHDANIGINWEVLETIAKNIKEYR
jgi:hypothetical protein